MINDISICGLKVLPATVQDKNKNEILDTRETVIENPIAPLNIAETAQVMDKLNRDAKDPHSNFSSIDFNTRLSPVQTNVLAWHDALVEFHCSPKMSLALTRAIKRNLVSLEGKGREEGVRIHGANREHSQNLTFKDRLKNAFSRNKMDANPYDRGGQQ